MNNKEKYIEFAKTEAIPIYSQPFWLNSVAGNNWNVAIIENNNKIIASLPYVKTNRKGLIFLEQAMLTQKLGIYIKYPDNQKYSTKLKFEKKIINSLLSQLPQYDVFKQNFDYNYHNILPFHWKGYNTKIKYTYLIESANSSLAQLRENLDSSVRNQLKKTQNYQIKEISDIKTVYELNQSRFNRLDRQLPFSFETLESLYKELSARNQCKIMAAFDGEEIMAISFFVWDKISVYYMMGGVSDKNKGGMNILIWEGIKLAQSKKLNFDFEGSMNENIEKFFRSFGAIQKIIIYVYKLATKRARFFNNFKKLI